MRYIITFLLISCAAFAIDTTDQTEIQNILYGQMEAWNKRGCQGFADGYTDDADFVNIYGMHFTCKSDIETRHLKILQSFYKGSEFKILDIQLREAAPGVVIAIEHWGLDGFRSPGPDNSAPSTYREGLFTHVFLKQDDQWKITATQNTLLP